MVVTEGTLVRQAQAAMLGAFDRFETVSAAQLRAAAAGFSEITANRGRAELTRNGVLIRSRRGMDGDVTYTIGARQLALPAAKYHPRRSFEGREQRQRIAGNAIASLEPEEYDEIDDDDDDADYETRAAGGPRAWMIFTVAVLICGVVFVRRWGASLPIGKADVPWGLPPYGAPPLRTPRTNRIVAPYPGDDAYSPSAPSDEMVDPSAGPRAYPSRFGTFPGTFDFVPDSGA
jgi:hypothetical protein